MRTLTLFSVLMSSYLTIMYNVYVDRNFWWPKSDETPAAISSSYIAPTYSSLRATVFAKCVGCHSDSGYGPEDFTNYHDLISSGKVVPGSARASKIFVETATMRMPLQGPKLSRAELVALEQWINSGALNN